MGALRNLSVSQQVGLLFVILFGLLTIVSIVAYTRSLRDRPPEMQERFDRFLHDLRAVWLGSVLFWVSWASGSFISTLLFGVLSFVALREFVTLTLVATECADERLVSGSALRERPELTKLIRSELVRHLLFSLVERTGIALAGRT